MPVYNGEKYIKQAIDSLLHQSYEGEYDILIIDDGSTDQTVSIIESYSCDRLHLLKNETNLKVAATLNRGLDLITGEYIVRMDADDISHVDRLKIQIDFMDAHPHIAVCGSLYSEDETLFKKEGNTWNKQMLFGQSLSYTPDVLRSILPFSFVLNHSTVVFRNKVLREKNYRYNTQIGYIEDYDLWLRMIYHEDFYIVPFKLLAYRMHADAVSYTDFSSRGALLEGLFSNYFKEYSIPITKQELQRFCSIRAKIMHQIAIEEDEKRDFLELIKQKFYSYKSVAQHIHPDYLRSILKKVEVKGSKNEK